MIQVSRGRGSCFTAFWLEAPRLAAAIVVQVRPGGARYSSEMCLLVLCKAVYVKKENKLRSVILGTAREGKRVRVFPFLVACEAELTLSIGGPSRLKRYVLVWSCGKWLTILDPHNTGTFSCSCRLGT